MEAFSLFSAWKQREVLLIHAKKWLNKMEMEIFCLPNLESLAESLQFNHKAHSASAMLSTSQNNKKLLPAKAASSRGLNDSKDIRAVAKRKSRLLTERDDVSRKSSLTNRTCGSDDQSTTSKRKEWKTIKQSRINMGNLLSVCEMKYPSSLVNFAA